MKSIQKVKAATGIGLSILLSSGLIAGTLKATFEGKNIEVKVECVNFENDKEFYFVSDGGSKGIDRDEDGLWIDGKKEVDGMMGVNGIFIQMLFQRKPYATDLITDGFAKIKSPWKKTKKSLTGEARLYVYGNGNTKPYMLKYEVVCD